MAKNKIQVLGQTSTTALATKMVGAIGAAPESYGVDEEDVLALQADYDEYRAAIVAASMAESNLRAAVRRKADAKAALAGNMAKLARIAYAFPNMTDTLLSAAGLAIRSVHGPLTAKVPNQLMAMPYATGEVDLSWNRAGNPYGVSFLVEARQGGSEWLTAAVTNAAKIRLNGYAPGVETWFRVRAIARSKPSAPSVPFPIYANVEGEQLKLAV